MEQMSKQTKFSNALNKRLIPVVAIQDANHADSLSGALLEGGLSCAEITFRTKAALEAISILARRGDITIGAGTVLNVEQAKMSVDAGACFIVSPGFDPKVVQYCLDNNVPVTPGVCTPSDIQKALDYGLKIVKFFPAEAFGGISTLKALSAPFTMMKFIPTGGINSNNLMDYLKHPSVRACGGSWMVKSSLIADGKFDEITRLTREAMTIISKVNWLSE